MSPIMNPEMIEHGRGLEHQVAGVMQLVADLQDDLDQLAGMPAVARAAAALAQRRAALEDTVATLRQDQGELELRLEQRNAELASREDALEITRSQLQVLTRRLVQVQEDERRALARDLHDTSGQAMTVINVGLAMLKRDSGCSDKTHARIEDLRRVATTVAEDLHRLSVNLRPSSLDRYGLVPALEDLVASLRKQTGIEVDFAVEGLDDRLPGEMETALYRVVQEATTNMARYSEASRASVSLRGQACTVEVRVADNGRGFDVAEALSRGRLGLLGMRERAEMLGGTLTIESRPGEGSAICAEVPLSEPALPVAFEAAGAGVAGPAVQPLTPVHAGAPSEAAELARAKALSDALVDITAGMARAHTSDELLAFVLARSAEAIGCDHGYLVVREGDEWRISHGFQLPDGMAGSHVSDQDVPAAAEAERTGELVVVNDLQADGVPNGMARRWGARSAASLPLVSAGQFFGVATYVHGAEAMPIRPSEVEFLARLASLVSLALENSRLHETEDQQRAFLEATFAVVPLGLAVIAGDSLKIELANTAYRALTPHPDVDPTGCLYGEIWPEAEGFDKGTAWLTGVLETGIPLDIERHRRVFPDGSERYFAFHVRRLSWRGEPAALTVLVDTTGLHETQHALEVTNDKLESAYVEVQAQAEELAETNAHLEAERDRLSTLIANIPDEIWFADAGANITAANLAAVRGVGLEASDAPFQAFPDWTSLEMLNPDGNPRPVDQTPLLRALRGERVERQEEIVRHRRTGKWRYRQASGEAIRDSSGAIAGAVLVVRDLTDEKRAEEERLRAVESRARGEAIYRAIAQSFPSGAIYVFDHDLRYLVVEGEAVSTFGQVREDMEGRTIWETMDPDTAGLIEPRYRRTLAGESMHFETRHGPQHQNRVVSADYRPIRSLDGQVVAGLLVARDLTERVRMEELLRQATAEVERERDVLSTILTVLPSGLIVYDRAGQITRINDLARDMLGYDEETWKRPVGERVTNVVQLSRPGGAPLAWEEYPAIRALGGEVVRNIDLFLHLPAQPEKDFWVMLSACPVHGPAGDPEGAVITLTDVTTIHQARASLQEANQALQQQADELREAKERLEQRVQERTIEMAVMLDQLEVNRGQLQALSRRLVEMQEHERSYVADQLYNQAAQVLAAVRMQLWAWEKHQGEREPGEQLTGMKQALDQTILALHDLATQLRPAGLARATLTAVLRDYVSRFAAAQGMAFRFEAGETEDLRVPAEVVTAVYRTIQEAVANVTQHAHASEVELTLSRAGDSLVVCLADNGSGFNPSFALANGGVGLIGMRERVKSAGGRLDVSSSPDGTRVLIEVPVDPIAAV